MRGDEFRQLVTGAPKFDRSLSRRINKSGHQEIILDRDVGLSGKALNQAVKRSKQRFPADFMFRLTEAKTKELVTNCDRFQTLKHFSVSPVLLQRRVLLWFQPR